MPWVLRGLLNGIVTSRWPRRHDDYFDGFASTVRVRRDVSPSEVDADVAWLCPTAAITGDRADGLRIDQGRCILCGRCVVAAPEVFEWATGADSASLSRRGLVVGAVPETDETLAAIREALAARVRALRRSVHIRHVDAGSDGSDEWEVQALLNPVYDVHRLGIFITPSPRHADILLVTGIGAAAMTAPLRRTLDAMPTPTVVIAAGTDAVSGGLVGGGYTGGTGIDALIPVDVWVPGSPASPFSLLHAILLALGRVPIHPDEPSRS